MTRIIILDLDNTLLRSDKSISEHTISVLKACQARGIKVAFATARSTQAASEFLALFAPDILIVYGGSLSLAGEEVISRFDIPADISSQLISECLREPEIASILAINETVAYANRIDPSDTFVTHYQCVDFSRIDNVSYLKISVVAANPGAVERIAAHYPTLDLLRYSGEDLYRFANRKALKWNAIQAIAEYYHIPTERFVAFGDDIIDLEMIKNCGVGVAVGNAIAEVKAAANFICETNDKDGAAKWLEKHVL